MFSDVTDASAFSAVPSLETHLFSSAIATEAASNRARTAAILRVIFIFSPLYILDV
jgi:hypothetical protein